jgi:hypothetical protein
MREIRLVRADPETFFRQIRAAGGLTLDDRRSIARRIAGFEVPYGMHTHRNALAQPCVIVAPHAPSLWHPTFFLLRAHDEIAIITRMTDGWTIGGTVPDLQDALDLMTLAIIEPDRLQLTPGARPIVH